GVVAVGALVAALGAHTPVYPALAAVVPPLRLFRYLEKYFVVVALAAAVLAANGFEALARGGRRTTVVAAVAAGVVALAAIIYARAATPLAALAGVPAGARDGAAAALRDAMLERAGYSALVGGAIVACAVACAAVAKRDRVGRYAQIAAFAVVAC